MQRMLDAFLEFSRDSESSAVPAEEIDPGFMRQIVEDAQRAGQHVELRVGRGQGLMPLRPWLCAAPWRT